MTRSMNFPLVDARLCGLGEGPLCCVYLTVGEAGFQCAKADSFLAAAIRERADTMVASITPEADYPTCQVERRLMAL